MAVLVGTPRLGVAVAGAMVAVGVAGRVALGARVTVGSTWLMVGVGRGVPEPLQASSAIRSTASGRRRLSLFIVFYRMRRIPVGLDYSRSGLGDKRGFRAR